MTHNLWLKLVITKTVSIFRKFRWPLGVHSSELWLLNCKNNWIFETEIGQIDQMWTKSFEIGNGLTKIEQKLFSTKNCQFRWRKNWLPSGQLDQLLTKKWFLDEVKQLNCTRVDPNGLMEFSTKTSNFSGNRGPSTWYEFICYHQNDLKILGSHE